MVHVSEAGGRHKMLAFTTPAEPTFTGIDSIIKVNNKEVVTFNDSSPSSGTTRHDNNTTKISAPGNNYHHNNHNHHNNSSGVGLIGIHSPKSPASAPSSIVPKTILKNSLNSASSHPKYRLSDKMFSEEDSIAASVVAANNNANNGNANYLADTINSNSMTSTTNNPITMPTSGNMNYDHHELDLISHGLTDSVCETIKLLESEYDKKGGNGPTTTSAASLSSGISASSSSTSGGIGGGHDDEQPPNVVYTEEIVISTARSNSSAVTGVTKPGIMKTFSSFSSTSSSNSGGGGGGGGGLISRRTPVEQWKSQLNEEGEEDEAMSQSNESEETPLLAGSDNSQHAITSTQGDNISNDSMGTTGTNASGSGGGGPSSALHKLGKMANGAKATGLKRVSFGSSKGSMVETLIYESPVSDQPGKSGKAGTLPILANGTSSRNGSRGDAVHDSPDSIASGGSTGGSRPPSRVRVTFFESEKPLAVSSPESDIIDFDPSKMTIHGSPSAHDPSSPSFNRQMITVEGWDNPFRPDGDLSKEADQIVELIKEGKPINDETLRSKSPSVNEPMNTTSSSIPTQNQLNASPKGKEVNGSATNGTSGPVDIQHTVVTPAAQAGQVEHVVLKKKKGCCVIQ